MLYLIKFTVLLGFFLLAYLLMLKHDKRFVFNRVFLWASLILSLVIPKLSIPLWYDEPVIDVHFFEILSVTGDAVSPSESNSTTTGQSTVAQYAPMQWWLVVWGLGGFLMLLRLIFNLFSILRIIQRSRPGSVLNQRLYFAKEVRSAFSFFGRIVVPSDRSSISEEVLAHELIHVQHWHSIDSMLIELLLVIGWFHPLLWLFRKEIKLNHEFTADNYPARPDRSTYCKQLIDYSKASSGEPDWSVGNSFSYLSIKNRIKMIHKNKQPNRIFLRNVLLIAFLLVPAVLSLSFMQVQDFSIDNRSEKYTVVIDAGHGGIDAGATADFNNVTESNLNLLLAKEIQSIGSEKINIVLTREKDEQMSLSDRKRLVKEFNADFLISIHCNFAEEGHPTGFTANLGSEQKAEAWKLVDKLMVSEIVNEDYFLLHRTELQNAFKTMRTQNADQMILMKDNPCPSLMLNFGSVNNKKEQSIIAEDESRKVIARVIIDSLEQLSSEETDKK